MKEKTLQALKDKAISNGGKLLSTVYTNNKAKYLWECSCGNKWETTWAIVKRGAWCPICSRSKKSKTLIDKYASGAIKKKLKHDINTLIQIAKDKGGECLSTEYTHCDAKYKFKDSKGRVFELIGSNVISSDRWSPYEAREKMVKYKIQDLADFAISKNGKCLSGEYLGYKNGHDWECSENHKWNATWFSVKNGGTWCPVCSRGKMGPRKFIIQDLKDFAKTKGGKCLSDNYAKHGDDYLWEDSKGRTWKANWANVYNRGTWSPYENGSKKQEEIYKYIKSLYSGEVIYNDRKALDGLELDIYVPEYNFAFEFDGIYWHSTKMKPDAKKANTEKARRVKEKGINILCIFEDEWGDESKRELIKAMIRHRLHIKPPIIKRASKLEIRYLKENKYYREFFNKFHLDGHSMACFAYGLFDGEKLVSCMSFRKNFKDKTYEICRLATDYNYRVHGAAGRMIKKYVSEVSGTLVTFSNNRLSLGGVYKTLGFRDITKTKAPSYYYTDFSVRVWRFKCKRINNKNLTNKIMDKIRDVVPDGDVIGRFPTETAQAEGGIFSRIHLGHDRAMYKIYDYGHTKWLLNKE